MTREQEMRQDLELLFSYLYSCDLRGADVADAASYCEEHGNYDCQIDVLRKKYYAYWHGSPIAEALKIR